MTYIVKILRHLKHTGAYKEPAKRINKQITSKQQEINNKTMMIAKLFEKWQMNDITKEDFLNLKDVYNNQISQIENQIINLKQEETTLISIVEKKIEWMDTISYHFGVSELSREMVLMMIECLYIHEGRE